MLLERCFMAKKNLNLDEVMAYIEKLPFTQFKSVVELTQIPKTATSQIPLTN